VNKLQPIWVLGKSRKGWLSFARRRDIDDIETTMQFDRTTGRWSVLGAASVVRMTKERRQILDALWGSSEPLGPSAIAAATGMKDGNIRFLLGEMVKKGEVSKTGRGAVRAEWTIRARELKRHKPMRVKRQNRFSLPHGRARALGHDR
jgi:hypothetical protein